VPKRPIPAPAGLELRLIADHRRLGHLLQDLIAALTRGERDGVPALWGAFEQRLLAHLASEEQTLIYSLLKTRPRESRVLIAEHNHLRSRVTDLRSALGAGTLRAIDATMFLHELNAHMRHEESVLYRSASEELDESELAALEAALLQQEAPDAVAIRGSNA
jgi:hemerythrin-like domain-containing protein